MTLRKTARRPQSKTVFSPPNVEDPATARALSDLETALDRVDLDNRERIMDVTLTVGVNRIEHGLGRAPSFVDLCPLSVADATFAWRFVDDGSNPNPRAQVWIETVGVTIDARIRIR